MAGDPGAGVPRRRVPRPPLRRALAPRAGAPWPFRTAILTTGDNIPSSHADTGGSPRQARWLLLRPVEEFEPDEQRYRQYLLEADAELRYAHRLAEAFGQIVRERQREQLDPWLIWAEGSGVPEFREVARVMQRDPAAVAAARHLGWSNGQTEGQITRLKYVTRQMYGRAGFGLLKQRVLRAA